MKEIDYTSPLSDEDVAYLLERLPVERVEHMRAVAAGSDFEETPESPQEPDADGAGAPPAPEPFDPSAHTVDEVLEYLSNPEVTDEERDAVLAAEAEGQARKGILG